MRPHTFTASTARDAKEASVVEFVGAFGTLGNAAGAHHEFVNGAGGAVKLSTAVAPLTTAVTSETLVCQLVLAVE